jgi:biotin carboxyl carrier protein
MKEYNYKIKGQDFNVKIENVEGDIAKVEVNGIQFDVQLEKPVAQPKPVVRAVAAPVKTVEAPKAAVEAAQVAAGVTVVSAPLPGTINDIKVTVGQAVKKGETVVVLEAMKMENNIDSDRDGKIQEVKVQKGDTVMEGAILVTIA